MRRHAWFFLCGWIGLLGPLRAACAADPVTVRVEKNRIDFRVGEKHIVSYRFDPAQAKPFIWPIIAPNGAVVTRAWPMAKAAAGGSLDHPHQKSGWLAHGDVIPDGMAVKPKKSGVQGVDFWAEIPVHGRIVCTGADEPNDGQITTHNDWRMPDGAVILRERRTILLVPLERGNLLIVEADFETPLDSVTFGDTKEGFFGVRVNDQLRTDFGKNKPVPPANVITNANGKHGEKECWGRPADWCDYSGAIDGRTAGVSVFDDPTNRFRACWHVRGYGLLAANPFGRAESKFPAMSGRNDLVRVHKGEHLKFRYAIYAHDGDAVSGKVAEAFAVFVELRR